MMMIVGGLLRRYWLYFALGALVFLSITLARRNGALNAKIDQLVLTLEVEKDIRDAGDNTPRDRNSLVGRLRDGGF